MGVQWQIPEWVKRETVVVGTEYYSVAVPKASGKVFQVQIVREPKNKHDKLALAVRFKGSTFGYLSRHWTEKLSPIFDRAGVDRINSTAVRRGTMIFVAMITREPDLEFEIGLPVTPTPHYVRFTLKAAKTYADSYIPLCPKMDGRYKYTAVITRGVVTKGKYEGHPIWRFWVNTLCIGEASPRYREGNEHFYAMLDAGLAQVEVELCRFADGGPWGSAVVQTVYQPPVRGPHNPAIGPRAQQGLGRRATNPNRGWASRILGK